MTESNTPPSQPKPSAATVTRLNPKWWVKIAIFGVVLLAFGGWGYYDATVVYPDRGREASLGLERDYLEAVKQSNPGDFTTAANVSDPKRFLADAVARKQKLLDPEQKRVTWLESLATVKMADAAHTSLPRTDAITGAKVSSAGERLAELDKLAADKYQSGFPKALSGFDIPTQWVIMAVGLIGGVWIAVILVRTKMRTYRWDPSEQRLTLPNGISIVPSDIVEFDKRKWDKFIITLKIREGHDKLSGQPLTLDLYPHIPLEEWVLEMERTVFPDSEIAQG